MATTNPRWNGHIVCTNCEAKCADWTQGAHLTQTLWFHCPSPQCNKRTWWKMLARRDHCPNDRCWYKQYDNFPRWGDKKKQGSTELRRMSAD